jgi:DNA-binding NarL/FixJ family response regulator
MTISLSADQAAGPDLASLTAQEMNCALAIAQGMTNRQAASALFISPKTIEYHLSKIYGKLKICSRTQLTRIITHAAVTTPGGLSEIRVRATDAVGTHF